MTELERVLAESLKRLDEEHAASVSQLNESVSQLNGRVDALLADYQQLVGEYERLATAYRRLEADMNSIVRASSGRWAGSARSPGKTETGTGVIGAAKDLLPFV